MRKAYLTSLVACVVFLQFHHAEAQAPSADVDACPGYRATNVRSNPLRSSLSADLELAGEPCNVYGEDIPRLRLDVVYETKSRIHVKITDPANKRYEVPESVFPRPSASRTPIVPQSADIQFSYTRSPFSFTISRTSTKEVLFSTENNPIVFQSQYLRLKTSLPPKANIYGLGEHTNTFRLPSNATRTLWSRDAYGISPDTNLYGNHPIYFEHRTTGSHGVFLLNSNGMDIKLSEGGLEYNVIGGVFDFYFLAGSRDDPTELARQYAEVAGLPAEVPFWSFGFHQCRFGYRDFVDVANVITNYSAAGIPLETMWTDIDYMDRRRTFTLDPDYFPLNRMREIVDYLHEHDQHYIVMTDPAMAYLPNEDYGPYHRGVDLDIWLKASNGSESLGLVWPGVTVYPDWFHPNIAKYWNGEFDQFYHRDTGLDIDGAWIDMNEPASFCEWPCEDVFAEAIRQNMPPPRSHPPPDPNAPIFQSQSGPIARQDGSRYFEPVQPEEASPALTTQVEDSDLLDPPYRINNAAGFLSSRTAWTNAIHANGLTEYDTHNLYGTMMSTATRTALINRRPGLRPLIITRSTFAGAGRDVGKWLGDNLSLWDHYRFSIAGMLGFASVYGVPMVGSDICGFGGDTTEELCARWATLGAFYPFMRNHNGDTSISQEFYLWESVANAARNAINIRYRLLDYFYTAFHQAHLDGSPVLHPLWFKYPKETSTFPIEHQFFFGDSILVSPVTEQGSTSVNAYLPKDIFYDFKTGEPVEGSGAFTLFEGISTEDILVHIKGGAVLPLRVESAMTIKALRQKAFELVVAPDTRGRATGKLYVDDGVSVTPPGSLDVQFEFNRQKLRIDSKARGRLGQDEQFNVERVKFLGVEREPRRVEVNGRQARNVTYHQDTLVLEVAIEGNSRQLTSVEYS